MTSSGPSPLDHHVRALGLAGAPAFLVGARRKEHLGHVQLSLSVATRETTISTLPAFFFGLALRETSSLSTEPITSDIIRRRFSDSGSKCSRCLPVLLLTAGQRAAFTSNCAVLDVDGFEPTELFELFEEDVPVESEDHLVYSGEAAVPASPRFRPRDGGTACISGCRVMRAFAWAVRFFAIFCMRFCFFLTCKPMAFHGSRLESMESSEAAGCTGSPDANPSPGGRSDADRPRNPGRGG